MIFLQKKLVAPVNSRHESPCGKSLECDMITPSTTVTRNGLRAANAVRAVERKRRAMRKIAIMGVAAAIAAGATRAAETLTWTGAESPVWDLTAVNWTNESGVARASFDGPDAGTDFRKLLAAYARRMFNPSEFMKMLKQNMTMSFDLMQKGLTLLPRPFCPMV